MTECVPRLVIQLEGKHHWGNDKIIPADLNHFFLSYLRGAFAVRVQGDYIIHCYYENLQDVRSFVHSAAFIKYPTYLPTNKQRDPNSRLIATYWHL